MTLVQPAPASAPRRRPRGPPRLTEERVYARHDRLARAVRAAVAAWVVGIVCRDPGRASSSITAVRLPECVDGGRALLLAKRRLELELGAGLAACQRALAEHLPIARAGWRRACRGRASAQ